MCDSEPKRGRRCRWRLWAAAALLAAPTAFVLAAGGSYVRCMAEQLAWRPEDSSRITVEDIAYAPQGIALTVRSAEPVQEVWRQSPSFLPWRRQHVRSAFRARRLADGLEQILVEYEFAPKGEWLLALKSAAGFWAAMSPYFSSQPDMDRQSWSELWSSTERRVPL